MQNPTHPDTHRELGEGERILSGIGGSLLVYYVSKKRTTDALLLLGGSYLLYRAITGDCPIGALWKNRRNRRTHPANVNVRTQVVVSKPPGEVYAYWRNLENWPQFMKHLESVDQMDNNTSAWRMKLSGIGDVRWEAKIVRDEKDSELSLSSVPGSPLDATAKLNFSPTPGNATRVDVMLSYRAPMGVIGERLSRLLTPVFREKVEADIHNFKHYIEDAGKDGD
jgi:uncharacterized membrane protein